ncbi:tellurite resistance TerB family protein [Aeromonas simiae]|uniref:Tellurite resistance TerB family protein n=1 Tax=Aeromonas simiae TaxID=218936 RepID=A0A5J6WYZ1_9GAMM|nr:tellurite resistance TerB family protein [Aeromonas simiae]QFI54943.1 tellurite resistance TerB family protein [Aeromonas simiae]
MRNILDQLLGGGKTLPRRAGEKYQGQRQGALGLLLGHQKARKYRDKVATLGGISALGKLAYSLYRDWLQQQKVSPPTHVIPQPLHILQGNALEIRADLLVRAMIAAARADGHVDEVEHETITGRLTELGFDNAAHFIGRELMRPLDPYLLAREVTDMEQATEVYFVSLLAIEVDHFMERGYLDELAKALRLAPELRAHIEARVAAL